jgi:suppressor of ftsI
MKRLLGPEPGQVSVLDGEIVVGREGDLRVEDTQVSRRHAAVRPVPDGVEVEDLGSSNGTFVDGKRIEGKVTLRENATLRVGKTQLEIEIEVEDPGATRFRPAPPAPADPDVPQPDVTRARPIDPGATRFRPRPPLDTPTETPAPAAPAAPAAPPAPHRSRKRVLAFAAVGIVVAAGAAVAAVLVLGGSSKKTASAVKPHCAAHFPTVIRDGFPEPPMQFSRGGVLDATLVAALGSKKINGTVDQLMEFNKLMPATTFVVCPGDLMRVDLVNKLPIPMNLHVHGLHVSPKGHGDNIFLTINPLQTYDYRYQLPLDHEAGAFWYHPHLHGLVDVETTAGLIGAIIVEGGLDNVLSKIPQRIIVIHGGKLVPPGGKPLPIPGTKPGQIKPPPNPGPKEDLVNGAYDPTLRIRPGQLQRWRIWNSTGERELKIVLPGTTFQLLAKDGNTLQHMRPMKTLLIGAGERVEVLVRGGPAGKTQLQSLRFQPCFRSCFDPFGGVPQTGRDFGFQPLLTVVSGGARVNDRLPTAPLANPPDLRTRTVDVHRTIMLARHQVPQKPPEFPVSGKLFDPNRVDVTMKLNSVEEWTIKNECNGRLKEWHNWHIHQNPFQLISVNGRPVKFVDWQDTLNIAPCATVVIRLNPVDFTGKFVMHCHLTFHEDHGMMAVVQVLAHPTPAQVKAHTVVYMVPPANHNGGVSASALSAGARSWSSVFRPPSSHGTRTAPRASRSYSSTPGINSSA